jgi:integrase
MDLCRVSDAALVPHLVQHVVRRFVDPARAGPAAVLASPADAQDDRLHALWCFLLDSGARRGEAAALRWSDVDGVVVTIRRNRVHAGRDVIEHTTKSDRVRRVELDVETVAVLRRWRTRQLEERMAGEAYSDEGYVFSDALGHPYRPDGLSDRFVRSLRGLGLPVVRLHDMRHTSGTLALANGLQPHVVQKRLGHADIATTLRLYSHVRPQHDGEAAAVIGRDLRPGDLTLSERCHGGISVHPARQPRAVLAGHQGWAVQDSNL